MVRNAAFSSCSRRRTGRASRRAFQRRDTGALAKLLVQHGKPNGIHPFSVHEIVFQRLAFASHARLFEQPAGGNIPPVATRVDPVQFQHLETKGDKRIKGLHGEALVLITPAQTEVETCLKTLFVRKGKAEPANELATSLDFNPKTERLIRS